jgi:uncharacterized Ntn-hydrolase superfamily protein
VVQGNSLVGPEVVNAVATTFEASEGAPRHLADRLIEAMAAGHATELEEAGTADALREKLLEIQRIRR